MTGLSNSRRNPIAPTAVSWRQMDDEIHVIQEFDELPGIYGITLQDLPNPSAIAIYEFSTGYTTGSFTGLTEFDQITTGNPSVGQFRVGSGFSTKVIFNSADDGKTVVVDYEGGGSAVTIDNIQSLIGTLTSIFEFITAQDTSGLEVRASDNTTVAAIFGEGNTSDVEVGNKIRALTSAGILFEANGGTDVLTLGAGGGSNATFAGGVNINGVLALLDGTAGAPTVKVGDEQNGLYSPGANRMGFVAGGVQQAEVNTGGLYAPGHVVQVVSTTKTDTFSTSSTSFVDVTGLSATITPKSTSSKILVLATIMASSSGGGAAYFNLVRDSTTLAIGDAAGSRTRATTGGRDLIATDIRSLSVNFLDSPASTSALVYKMQAASQSTLTAFVNRSGTDTDTAVFFRAVSTITVMEIAV